MHFAATGGSAEVVGAIYDMAPSVIDVKVCTVHFMLWHACLFFAGGNQLLFATSVCLGTYGANCLFVRQTIRLLFLNYHR